ncbi:hypothetical protein EDD85DRAFT_795011 [Armillaria nabsnona]|nr:hypothetical protein EDD85DRAFT_795011 [Armillaria nabsnona]
MYAILKCYHHTHPQQNYTSTNCLKPLLFSLPPAAMRISSTINIANLTTVQASHSFRVCGHNERRRILGWSLVFISKHMLHLSSWLQTLDGHLMYAISFFYWWQYFSQNLSLGTDQKFHGNTLYYPPSRFGLVYTLESHTPSTFLKICIFSTCLGLWGKELHPCKEKETKGCGNDIIDPLLFTGWYMHVKRRAITMRWQVWAPGWCHIVQSWTSLNLRVSSVCHRRGALRLEGLLESHYWASVGGFFHLLEDDTGHW